MRVGRIVVLGSLIAGLYVNHSWSATFSPTNYTPPGLTPIIPKLTSNYVSDSVNGLGQPLFQYLGSSVTYSLATCGRYIRFSLDPYNADLVFARNDWNVGVIGAKGSGNGQFSNPSDIDVYFSRNAPWPIITSLIIADTGNNRLAVLDVKDLIAYIPGNQVPCSYSAGSSTVGFDWRGTIGPADGFQFSSPMGVSIDDHGTATDITDDVVWVADTGNNRIYEVRVDIVNGGQQDLGTYGALGAGIDQFNFPIRVIRGRSTTGGDPATTRNNDELYVLDQGNNRIVHLHCTGNAPSATWVGSVNPPSAPDNLLESIASDCWGNIYVTDSQNDRIIKYSPDLELLASYGTSGRGVQTGEMSKPHEFRPQFVQQWWTNPSKVIGSNVGMLGERWDDDTGGQAYNLGVAIQNLSSRLSTSPVGGWFGFKLTDHAFTKIEVLDEAGALVRTLDPATTFHNSGTDSVFWDGRRNDGSLAPQCQRYQFSILPRTGYSASFDSLEMAAADFDLSPLLPVTFHVASNISGAYIWDNGNKITLNGSYAVACTTCTSSGTRVVSPPLIQTIGSARYRFGSWSDGKPMAHGVELFHDTTITLNLVPDDPPSPVFAAPYLRSPVGANPTSVAAGDFNQDGRPDLAVTDKNDDAVSILLGRGDGTYYPETVLPADDGPASVIVGDFNEDGWQDLVVGNSLANTLSLYRGNGDGTFQARTNISAGVEPRVFARNVNKDTHADLVVANAGSNTVSVYIGQGNGSFLPRTDYAVGSKPMSVRVEKLRAYGAQPDTFSVDIVVANYNSNTVSVLLGRGDGTFASPVVYATGANPRDLALADVTRNSVVDIVVANYGSSTISVLGGNGDGTFSAKTDYVVGSNATALLVEDFSGDGIPDVATVNYGSSSVSTLLGTLSGTFASRADLPLPGPLQAIAVGNLNPDRDAYRDLVVAGGGIQVLLGNGNGSFGVRREAPTNLAPNSIAFGDLNGDSRSDIVTTSGDVQNSSISVLLNTGGGTFAPRTDYSVAGLVSRDVHLVDVNGDGNLDAVYTSQTGPYAVYVRLGTGTGTFGPATTYATGPTPTSVAVGDVNNDGIPDFVVADNDGGEVRMRLGIGGGLFGSETLVFACQGPSNARLEDLNGDSRLDLVFSGGIPDAISILLGNGNGTFGTPVNIPTGDSVGGLAIGDVDRDGIKDFVVEIGVTSSIQIYKGYGNNTYGRTAVFPVPHSDGVTLGDFSGDGWPDLCAATSDGVSVLIGRGDGTFGTPTHFGTGGLLWAVAAFDVDSDGRLDVVGANSINNVVSILLNTVTITSVALGAPPAVSTLNQNFPNPFNPRTTVAFTLARGGPVQLFVFDVSGRLITRLVDGTLTAGPHEVVWSGLTHEGQTVASGVYYYRLQAPGFVRSRKMVLLK